MLDLLGMHKLLFITFYKSLIVIVIAVAVEACSDEAAFGNSAASGSRCRIDAPSRIPAEKLTIRGSRFASAPNDSHAATSTEASPDSSVAAMIETRVRRVPGNPDANELQGESSSIRGGSPRRSRSIPTARRRSSSSTCAGPRRCSAAAAGGLPCPSDGAGVVGHSGRRDAAQGLSAGGHRASG